MCLVQTLHAQSATSQTFRTPTGQVDQVRFERVAGGVINIFYDLKSDDPGANFAILLEVSLDGGQTFALRPRNVSGDVGPAIAAGLGKKIVWDAGKDVETVQIEQFRIRVTPERGAEPRSRTKWSIQRLIARSRCRRWRGLFAERR